MVDDEHAIAFDVLPRGTPVEDRNGARVGEVRQVLDNGREHIFDGIVITTEDGRRFVDAPEVARITNRRVTLTIDAAEVAALPVPDGLRRRVGRLRRRLGR